MAKGRIPGGAGSGSRAGIGGGEAAGDGAGAGAAGAGVWATAAPGYADRFFELRARRVAFVTGDSTNPVTVHLIRRVRRAEVEDGERFTVEYEVNGGVLAFQFVYTGAPRPRIRFVNQPRMAWERTGAARTLMPEIY